MEDRDGEGKVDWERIRTSEEGGGRIERRGRV